jgi:hypothetical protein
MTIAAGFKCRDGVILCADSQITLNQGKKYQAKIFGINKRAGIYLVYSGDVVFARELVDILQEALKERIGKSAVTDVKKIYKDFRREHYTKLPKDEKTTASILITAREGNRILLYYASSGHFMPVDTYEVLGIGQEYGEALFKPLYSKSLSCTEVGYIAIYGLWKVKTFVEGCGGVSHIREIPNEPGFLPKPRWLAETDMKRIEADYEFFETAISPLIPVFPDRQTDRAEFQAQLAQAVNALKKRRTQILRGRDLTMVGTWFETYG